MKLTAETACLWIVTACASFLLIEGALLARETRFKIDRIAGDFDALKYSTQRMEANVSAASNVGAQVLAKERIAFDAQQIYFAGLTLRTNRLLDSANDTVKAVNDGFLPAISETVRTGNSAILRASDNFDRVGVAAQISLGRIGPAVDALTSDAETVRPSLDNFGRITAHGVGISANLDATTQDVRDFVHRETTPVQGTWNLLKNFLREFAGPAAEVATSIK